MFIIKKKVGKGEYYYLRKSERQKDGKIKAVTVAYLGKDKEDAKKKAEKIIQESKLKNNKLNKVENKEKNMEEKNKDIVKITYFVHGTTTDNEEHISSGWKDVGLSELGVQQSKDLPDQIGNKKFDAVFCSDLKRAVDSANLAFSRKFKIIKDKRLREADYGDYTKKSSKWRSSKIGCTELAEVLK